MVSIYKLLILTIVLQIMIGLAYTSQYDPSSTSLTNIIENRTSTIDSHQQTYNSEGQVIDATSGFLGTIGNSITWGGIVFNTVLKSFMPLNALFKTNGKLETMFFGMIEMFRILLNGIIIIKAYNMFFNKDTQ